MAFKILAILAVVVVAAHGAVVPAPLAVAPYATSYAAQVTHHAVAAPIVAAPATHLVAAPAAPLLTAPVAAPAAPLIAAPLPAPVASSVVSAPIVSQFVPPASLLLK